MEPTQPTTRHDDDNTTTTTTTHARAAAAAAAALARSLARARARAVAVAMAVAIAVYDARAFDDARAMSHSRVGFDDEIAALVGKLNARVYKGAETPVFFFFCQCTMGPFQKYIVFFGCGS